MTETDVVIVAEIIRRAVDAAIVAERRTTEGVIKTAVEALQTRVGAIEAAPPRVGPPGKDGAPGPAGPPGADGRDGTPGLSYAGVFVDGKQYDHGQCVTYGGSLWHCNAAAATGRPADGSREWTLIVKRGRDGRDARA